FAGNPVENGLVESLSRPGGNVTGLSGVAAELAGKHVELIREALPSAGRVDVLANESDPFSKPFIEQLRQAGIATGLAINAKLIRGEEIEATFTAIAQARPDAVVVQGSLPTKRAAELALKYGLPAFYLPPEEGGLMTYLVIETEVHRRAAAFID